MSEQVTIPQDEYDFLLKKSDFLDALESAGVDNWDGYSIAWREVYGEYDN